MNILSLYSGGSTQDHRYLIEVDCSLGQFKSDKLKDKQFTINAPIFSQHCKKEMDPLNF